MLVFDLVIVVLIPILYGVVNRKNHELSQGVTPAFANDHDLLPSHLKLHHSLTQVNFETLLLHLASLFILVDVFTLLPLELLIMIVFDLSD